MNLLRAILLLLLPFATAIALGQNVHASKPTGPAEQAEALVRSLYEQVVAHHPIGIPEDADMKIFAPYLGKALLHRIDLARACGEDWHRQHPDPNLKPPFAVDSGLFSGDDEEAEPREFRIEKTQSEKDGSFRVYVGFTLREPHAPRWSWRVAAVVVQQKGRFAVDDVIYLKDEARPVESRLSGYLSYGCDGPHWVGQHDQRH